MQKAAKSARRWVTLFQNPGDPVGPAPPWMVSEGCIFFFFFLDNRSLLGSELIELRVLMQFTYRSIRCTNICCHRHLHAAFIC